MVAVRFKNTSYFYQALSHITHLSFMTLPLISCICVTRGRSNLLKRAIRCFNEQTYPNKELIILYEDDDLTTNDFLVTQSVEAFQNIQAIKIPRSNDQHLGRLRNLAIQHASGTYICQWDDDDWYHPERLQYQYKLLIENDVEACVLSREIIFDVHTENAYLSCIRNWEGSLLCSKEKALGHPYINLVKGEDTPTIEALRVNRDLYTDTRITPYYVYVYHGTNTWDYTHFKKFFAFSKIFPKELSTLISTIINTEPLDTKDLIQFEQSFNTFVSRNVIP
jgi:glycosyltransferase involved in cell wall biosynthesis